MYCPCCGEALTVMTKTCSACGMSVNEKLYSLEAEKTASDLKKIDINQNRKFALLSYLGPLIIIPFIFVKNSDFVKFHNNQGLLLCVLYIVSALSFLLPNLGSLIGYGLSITALTFAVMGIMNVIKGETKDLPLIGKFKILK